MANKLPRVVPIRARSGLVHDLGIQVTTRRGKSGRDRFITRDDLGQAMLPYRIASEAAINEIIDDVDTSKDGKINYSEFKAMIKEEMREYAEKQRKLEF
ncbi:hypothetical protein TIFTF001_016325 [Ficus carica]|uniref:EF-hand domain-containing protein n=1 Tax=Ficus carica TaxID=3494 RepID=A0AA88A055_FICCA|nr:hypothetical protein TIFTF001_016325 [Ficus carica]